MTWISGVVDRIKSKIAELRKDPIGDSLDAAYERIEALTADDARRECLTTLDGAAHYKVSETPWQVVGFDLPASVADVFGMYEWISFGGDDKRLDRSFIAVEPTNPDFIIIGSDMELGRICAFCGREGVNTADSFVGFSGEYAMSATLYHFLLKQIWLYGSGPFQMSEQSLNN